MSLRSSQAQSCPLKTVLGEPRPYQSSSKAWKPLGGSLPHLIRKRGLNGLFFFHSRTKPGVSDICNRTNKTALPSSQAGCFRSTQHGTSEWQSFQDQSCSCLLERRQGRSHFKRIQSGKELIHLLTRGAFHSGPEMPCLSFLVRLIPLPKES